MSFNHGNLTTGKRGVGRLNNAINTNKNRNFSYTMNDNRASELNRSRMMPIEIIDLEDNGPEQPPVNHNGRKTQNDDSSSFLRDRDRINNKKSRFSQMNQQSQENQYRAANENDASSSNDLSISCGASHNINPLAQSGLMYPGLLNSSLTGNLGPNVAPPPNLANDAANYMMMASISGALMMDPNLLAMGQFAAMAPAMHPGILPQPLPVGPEANLVANIPSGPIKEIIECSSCTLYPPPANAPPPTTRERPNGCRTVFVGGLPDNITDAIIAEIFERCGKIFTQRLSKKNFCHIRFFYERSVDAAIFLSGYRIRIGNQTDLPNTGRLHVDFAQARDDQFDYECRQRQLQREQRHRERQQLLQRNSSRQQASSSPPPVLHYTEHEASGIAEKLKQDETFMAAVQVFITWLERGDCSKRNVNTFYSMIQSTNSHIRRLLNEKTNYEEEMQKAKDALKQKMHGVLVQFIQIEKVFGAACHKKVWDHFSKAQRKNIELWKNQASELRSLQMDDFVIRGDDEMDMSDTEDESTPSKMPKTDDGMNQQLKEENDSLRCQLEAYKNEVSLLRSDMMSELDQKVRELQNAQNSCRSLQQELADAKRKHNEEQLRVKSLETRLKSAGVRELLLKTKIADAKSANKNTDNEDDKSSVISSDDPAVPQRFKIEASGAISETSDAKFVGLVSTFLNVHPFGASTDYIWSYMHRIDPSYGSQQQIEMLLRKYPNVFREEISGIGAKLERKWVFDGFSNCNGVVCSVVDD